MVRKCNKNRGREGGKEKQAYKRLERDRGAEKRKKN